MTLVEAIRWIDDKATEQEQLGNIQEMEDYKQVAEYLRVLSWSIMEVSDEDSN